MQLNKAKLKSKAVIDVYDNLILTVEAMGVYAKLLEGKEQMDLFRNMMDLARLANGLGENLEQEKKGQDDNKFKRGEK